jgi:hypothetical protein
MNPEDAGWGLIKKGFKEDLKAAIPLRGFVF